MTKTLNKLVSDEYEVLLKVSVGSCSGQCLQSAKVEVTVVRCAFAGIREPDLLVTAIAKTSTQTAFAGGVSKALHQSAQEYVVASRIGCGGCRKRWFVVSN